MNKVKFLLFFIALTCIFSCKGPTPPAPVAGPVPVNIYEAKQEAASYHDLFPGTLVALNEVQIRSEVNGYITNIFFKDGQTVQKGQKLYEIERSKFIAAFEQAKANVQMAKANLQKVEKDAARYTALGKLDAIAKQRVEYAETDLENAKSQLTSANAQLRVAETDLRHSIITAPFTGTIGISSVKLGAFVSAAQTQLNTISSDDPIAVDFVVNEKSISYFIKIQNEKSKQADSTFTILLPDQSLYNAPGSIVVIDRSVDAQTGTIKVRLSFPNSEKRLLPGMSCTVRVLNKELKNPVLIPHKGVIEQMGEHFVYTIKNDTARQRQVKLGANIGDKVVIQEGLNPGESIILDGVQKLREGTPVQIGAPQPPTSPSASK